MNLHQCFAIAIAAQLSLGIAASPVIGVATARGGVRVDEKSVSGNGTLFEGTTVETTRAASDVKLTSGVRMQLASGSKGTVYSDRTVLERGESQLQVGGTPYRVDARSLRILAQDAGTVGRIQISSGNQVLVAALQGNLRVSTANGITVAALAAGRALQFDASQAGASAPSKLTGCLVRENGKLMLTDETTGVTVEVKGAGVEKQVGHKIEVVGTHIPGAMNPSGGATVQVSSVRELSKKCSSAAAAAGAAAAGASGAPGGGAAAGGAATAGVAAKAVIAGVVVAAAATGAALAVTAQDDAAISR